MKFGKQPALFINFSSQVFTTSWNGEKYEFQPGEAKPFAYGKAFHFAKSLAKYEMSRKGGENFREDWAWHVNVVIEKPEDLKSDPVFYGLFSKAFSENAYEEMSDEKSEDAVVQEQVAAVKKTKKTKKVEKVEKEFEELEK